MLSRLPGNSPLPPAFPPSSDASATASSGATCAPAAENDATPVSAAEPQATPTALPAEADGPSRDGAPAQIAGNAHHDPEAAAARRFWLPADAWSSIGEFLLREDVLRLRTVSREAKMLADESIQHLKIPPEGLPGFIGSDSFKSVTTLDVGLLDQAALGVLIAHLAAHPRPEMAIHLDGRHMEVDAATLAGLSALPLRKLVLKLHSATPDKLDALAACSYPIDLTAGHITQDALIAAANMQTLQRLATSTTHMNESIAQRFAAHGALETLVIKTDVGTSAQTLQVLASVPTLREFYINGRDGPDFDGATARALAANANLEDLKIVSNGPGPDENGYAALSQNQGLKTLHVPLRPAMLALAGMASLTKLTFGCLNRYPYAKLDAATAWGIAALPALETLAFPIMNRESGALTPILRDGTASRLDFSWITAWGNDDFLNADERTALMANTRLKAVRFHQGALHGPDLDAILHHPTIEYVKSVGREYIRRPDSQGTLTLRAPGE